MNDDAIPEDLRKLFAGKRPLDAMFHRLMELYGRAVSADRCLLFLYEPERHLARNTHAWQRKPEWALGRPDKAWSPISESLPQKDPLFAEALINPEALYIDDIETADPALVNAAYERESFGHKALIHAPLMADGSLWGILEPCTMEAPRQWTASDRAVTAWVQQKLTPLAIRYVRETCR